MGYILVFTTSGCLHSARLKKILSNRGIAYHEVNIFQYPLYVDLLDAQTGQRTVPQVFFNNDHIGVRNRYNSQFLRCMQGLEQVLSLLETHKLEAMAKEALQQQVPDHDFPTPSTLKAVQLHIKLNVVIEEVYQQIRQGSFLKKGKVKFKGTYVNLKKLTPLASDLVSWLIKQGKEKADAIKLGMFLGSFLDLLFKVKS